MIQCGAGIKIRKEIPVVLFEHAQATEFQLSTVEINQYHAYISDAVQSLAVCDTNVKSWLRHPNAFIA